MTEMFDTNLNLVVIRLVQEQNKSHMDIPNHTGLYKLKSFTTIRESDVSLRGAPRMT